MQFKLLKSIAIALQRSTATSIGLVREVTTVAVTSVSLRALHQQKA